MIGETNNTLSWVGWDIVNLTSGVRGRIVCVDEGTITITIGRFVLEKHFSNVLFKMFDWSKT